MYILFIHVYSLLSDTISSAVDGWSRTFTVRPRRNSNAQLYSPRRHPRTQRTQTTACWAQDLDRASPGLEPVRPWKQDISLVSLLLIAVMGSCYVSMSATDTSDQRMTPVRVMALQAPWAALSPGACGVSERRRTYAKRQHVNLSPIDLHQEDNIALLNFIHLQICSSIYGFSDMCFFISAL